MPKLLSASSPILTQKTGVQINPAPTISVKRPPPKPPQAFDKRPKEVDASSWKYPILEVKQYWNGTEHGPITWEMAKEWLGWETDSDYEQRTGNPLPDFLMNLDGHKIICHKDLNNRPFNETHCRELAQDILMRNWAGPTTLPSETVNGETIVIGRSGQVISGQHRLIALILARIQWYQQQNKWLHLWKTEPVIESLVVFGVSEARDVIKTIDNVMPRSVSDVFYTSDIFRGQGLTNADRKELSRMLDRELQFLWKRVGAGRPHGEKNYQTHSSAVEFLNLHKQKMLQALKIIYGINKQNGKTPRALSLLRLSPGSCAGALYLMGCSKSDEAGYRNANPPSEKELDWEMWDKAVEFWQELGDGKKLVGDNAKFNPTCKLPEVKQALALLTDEGSGASLSPIYVNNILARAWARYSCNEDLGGLPVLVGDPSRDNLAYINWFKTWLPIEYSKEKGKNVLLDPMDFGGIDLGDQAHEMGGQDAPSLSKEEKRKAAAEKVATKLANKRKAKAEKAEQNGEEVVEDEDVIDDTGEEVVQASANSNVAHLREELNNLKRGSNCNLLIIKTSMGYKAQDIDAKEINKLTKWKVIDVNGWLSRVEFNEQQYKEIVPKLFSAGFSVGLVTPPTETSSMKVIALKKEDFPKLQPGKPLFLSKPPATNSPSAAKPTPKAGTKKKCIACGGTGKSSKGEKCSPCKGTGST